MLPVPAFLPLETLPSWPAVPDPTVVQILIPTLFVPLAITVVIALLVLGPGWRQKAE